MMIALIISVLIAVIPGEDRLEKATSSYLKADGIQWSMKSSTYSPTFDETENANVEFDYNPPDTFYFKSPNEEIIGIADTVWTMSKKHHQIQKNLSEDNSNPADYILHWKTRYNLIGSTSKDNGMEFELEGHKGVSPPNIKLVIDKNDRLKSINYKDVSGNDVTLTLIKEKLSRIKDIRLFYKDIPSGYKLVDLTE